MRRALLCILLASTPGTVLAQTQSFDALIEETLKRHPPAPGAPPLGEPAPPLSETPPAAPVPGLEAPQPPLDSSAPVPPALLQQSETAPKPYTPPKIAPAPSTGVAPAPGDAAAAAGGTQAALPPSGERTRESLTPEEVNSATFIE